MTEHLSETDYISPINGTNKRREDTLMANSELSKIKILFLYDFFMTKLNPYDFDSSVSMSELLDILEKETGYRFERKSIYSDIDRLNDFMRVSGKIKSGSDDWIYKEKKRYKVSELDSQITVDEAKLLVDAVNTTAFTDSGIADKIKELYPSYFGDAGNSVSLVRRDHKYSARLTALLNNFRSCINEKCVISFNYGYKLGSAPAFKEKREVSPLALDWSNNTYYLIAVDNAVYDRIEGSDRPIETAIRRFRIDRIDSTSFLHREKFRGFANAAARQKAIDNVIKNSVNAFSSEDVMEVTISLSFKADAKTGSDAVPKKEVLRAYNILSDHLNIRRIVSDSGLDTGELTVIAETADVPTFYSYLFQAGTVPGIDLSLGEGPVRDKYIVYLENARKAL